MNIFKVNRKFNLGDLIISLLITAGGGFIVGLFIKPYVPIYKTLNKLFFFPAGHVFPIVWTILYILMAIAFYRILQISKLGKKTYSSLTLFYIQLIFNFLWSFIFFNFRLYGIAFIEAVILLILVFITTKKFFKVDKIAGWLMVPYVFWLTYASVLSYFVWVLNEM